MCVVSSGQCNTGAAAAVTSSHLLTGGQGNLDRGYRGHREDFINQPLLLLHVPICLTRRVGHNLFVYIVISLISY